MSQKQTLVSLESDEIIETLKRLDPDIAIIQEIDINCKRSGNVNHMESICKALGWKGGFVAEFFEVESPIRQPRDQVGYLSARCINCKAFPCTDISQREEVYTETQYFQSTVLISVSFIINITHSSGKEMVKD